MYVLFQNNDSQLRDPHNQLFGAADLFSSLDVQ